MINSRMVQTTRLNTHVLERAASGGTAGTPKRVMLVHGNVSSSAFFRELMENLPAHWHVIAPDLRGFGSSESRGIDATRGLRDWADDLSSLMDALKWPDAHLLGWSLGGGVVMQITIDTPQRVQTLTLVAPVSPYGFGGTHGESGTPNTPDYAGSGGGTVNAAFVGAVKARDHSDQAGSPRDIMRKFYFNAAQYQPPTPVEDAWVDAMLSTVVGEDNYPGDFTPTTNWPHIAPGTRGIANAFSPKYMNLSAFAELKPAPNVLWIHGEQDAIISDTSLFDLANLGAMGIVPGWPGVDTHPPQPMISQTRTVLEKAKTNGGNYHELILPGVGHSPFIEAPQAFQQAFSKHVESQ